MIPREETDCFVMIICTRHGKSKGLYLLKISNYLVEVKDKDTHRRAIKHIEQY